MNFSCRFLVFRHSFFQINFSNAVTAFNSSTSRFFLFSKDDSQHIVYFVRCTFFYVEQLLDESSPPRNNIPEVLNSTELPGLHQREAITISTVASQRPRLITNNSDSKDPTMLYGFWQARSNNSPHSEQPGLAPNPFIILAAMAVIQADLTKQDKDYSSQSPEPWDVLLISTPPLYLNTNEG